MKYIYIIIFITSHICLSQSSCQLAVLKYKGGGDWYANPSSLKNLISFCNQNLNMNIQNDYAIIEPNSQDLFNHPYIYMTGHGNVLFSQSDVTNMRKYLQGGGFLHIDDNYGMDASFRREMKRVFPEKEWVDLPFDHDIYHTFYLSK